MVQPDAAAAPSTATTSLAYPISGGMDAGLDTTWGEGVEDGSSLEADEDGPPQDMSPAEIAAAEERFAEMSFFGRSLEANEEGPPQDMEPTEIAAAEARFSQMSFFGDSGQGPSPSAAPMELLSSASSFGGVLDQPPEEPFNFETMDRLASANLRWVPR